MSPEEMTAAVGRGTHYLSKGNYQLVTSDGKLVTMDANAAHEAIQQGKARIPSAQESSIRGDDSLASDVTTFVEGAARGLTLGLSDFTASDTQQEAMDLRRETSPIAALAGTVAGSIPTGVGIGGAAARGAGAAGLRGLSQSVVAGATEGAAFGGQNLITETSLGNAELTAGSVITSIGGGALLGGGVSTVFGTAPAALHKISSKLRSQAVGEVSEEMEKQSLKALGITQSQAAKMYGKKKVTKAVRALNEPGLHPDGRPIILAGRTPQKHAERIHDTLEVHGPVIGKYFEDLDDHLRSVSTGDRAAKRISVAAVRKKGEQIAARLDRSAASNHAKKIRKIINTEWKGQKNWSFQEAQRQRKLLYDKAYPDIPGQKMNEGHKAFRSLERSIAEAEEEAAEKMGALIGKDRFQEWQEARNVYASLKDVGDYAEQAGFRDFWRGGDMRFGDKILGGAVMAGTIGATGGYGMGMAALGVTRSVLGFGKRHYPSFKVATMRRTRGLGVLNDMNSEAFKKVDRTAKEFAREGIKGTATRRIAVEAGLPDIKEQQADLAKLATNYQELTNRLGAVLAEMEDVAPQTAEVVARKLAETVRLLNNQVPKPPLVDGDPQIHLARKEWEPTREERVQFESLRRVVLQPYTIIDEFLTGNLSPVQIATVEALHPAVIEQIRDRIRDEVSQSDRRLTAEELVQYNILMGLPVGSARTGRQQAAYQARQEERTAARPPQRQVRTAEQYETRGQNLEDAI